MMTERGRVRQFGDHLIGTCVIHLVGDNGVPARVEVMVDSGFAGHLSLQPKLVDELQLLRIRTERVFLADGRTVNCDMYRVQAHWQEDLRTVEVASLNGHPLIGMGLLQGSELRMMVEDGGVIEVTPFGEL